MKISLFKTLNLALFGMMCASVLQAQDMKERASPPKEATGKIGDATVTINYSSPGVKGRKIWGGLVPYNQVWRAGANEATLFETDKDLTVEGNQLPAGKYSLYAIPGENEWTIIFNKQTGQWGTVYKEDMDAFRVQAKPKKSEEMTERLAYIVNDDGFSLIWENLEVPVSIKE